MTRSRFVARWRVPTPEPGYSRAPWQPPKHAEQVGLKRTVEADAVVADLSNQALAIVASASPMMMRAARPCWCTSPALSSRFTPHLPDQSLHRHAPAASSPIFDGRHHALHSTASLRACSAACLASQSFHVEPAELQRLPTTARELEQIVDERRHVRDVGANALQMMARIVADGLCSCPPPVTARTHRWLAAAHADRARPNRRNLPRSLFAVRSSCAWRSSSTLSSRIRCVERFCSFELLFQLDVRLVGAIALLAQLLGERLVLDGETDLTLDRIGLPVGDHQHHRACSTRKPSAITTRSPPSMQLLDDVGQHERNQQTGIGVLRTGACEPMPAAGTADEEHRHHDLSRRVVRQQERTGDGPGRAAEDRAPPASPRRQRLVSARPARAAQSAVAGRSANASNNTNNSAAYQVRDGPRP